MSLPARITTTASFAENKGEMCAVCKQRSPLVFYADGVGKVCPECDPKKSRAHLVEVVERPAK